MDDVVPVPAAEPLDRLREVRLLLEERVVVRAPVDEVRDLRVPRGRRVPVDQPLRRHLARVRLRTQLRLLREVGDPRPPPAVDDPGVEGLEPREDLEQRRLPAPVDAEQTDAVPLRDGQRDVAEEGLRAVGLGESARAEDGHEGARIADAARTHRRAPPVTLPAAPRT